MILINNVKRLFEFTDHEHWENESARLAQYHMVINSLGSGIHNLER